MAKKPAKKVPAKKSVQKKKRDYRPAVLETMKAAAQVIAGHQVPLIMICGVPGTDEVLMVGNDEIGPLEMQQLHAIHHAVAAKINQALGHPIA